MDHDQLASQKPADLDLQCFQNRDLFGFIMVRVKKTAETCMPNLSIQVGGIEINPNICLYVALALV